MKGGYFRDDYRDKGVSETTPYGTGRRRSDSLACLQSYREAPCSRTPRRCEIVNRDTTTQLYVQADYSAVFTAGGLHTLKAGAGVRRNGNVVDQRYPGGQVNVFWDSTFTSSVPGVGSARGAFGYYEVNDFGTGGSGVRQHRARLRAGPVDRRQPHAQRRRAA